MRSVVLGLLLCLIVLAQDQACPDCKARLKENAKFCGGGGKKVARSCPDCKQDVKPGAKFCGNCGKNVEGEAPRQEEQPKPEPPKQPEPPKPSEPTKQPDKPVGQDQNPDKVKLSERLARVGLTAEQVNAAIDRGAAFLAAQCRKRELCYDEDYLAAYALIHTKVFHTDPKLRDKIVKFLKDPKWQTHHNLVYVAGLRAMALEATKDPELQALTWECAQYLIEAQGPKGTWSYSVKVDIGVKAEEKKEESGIKVSGGEPIDEEPKGQDLTRKTEWTKGSDGDNSCTQFALLGLHAAQKCGFRVPKETWQRCLKEMESRWNKEDGGWGYKTGKTYGSMTCAGICSVALCRYYVGEKEYTKHDMLQAGIKWLAKNFSVDKNPGRPDYHPLYYLYSLERVGVFCDTELIGDHEWYPLGAKHLVSTQAADGSWKEGGDSIVGTSFALLFLTRATAPVKKEMKRGGKGWLQTQALNEHENFFLILDASGSMRDEIDGREKFEIAKHVIEQVVKKIPEGAQVGLRVYGHRYTALQREADTDSELVVPVGPLKPKEFLARVKALKCRGKTPITHSLHETIGDLSKIPAEVEIAIVLLTDGMESTRGADPVAAAAKLAASRKGIKLHVVGFDIGDDESKEQLERVARAGGGKYFHCRKAEDLMGALSLTTTGSSSYTLKNKEGKEVLKGQLGDKHELPEGKYTFVFELEGKKEERPVWINTEATTCVTVNVGKFMK